MVARTAGDGAAEWVIAIWNIDRLQVLQVIRFGWTIAGDPVAPWRLYHRTTSDLGLAEGIPSNRIADA